MSKKLSRKASDVLSRNGSSVRRVRANLRNTFQAATDQDILGGLVWYADAHAFAFDLARATDTDLVTVAAVIAALSPQTRWEANKVAATELLKNGTRAAGMLVSNHERALRVLRAGQHNALSALQIKGDESAPKIAAFARNILGDTTRVTIDVWATRAALGAWDSVPLLSRVGMYDAIADQYRFVAAEYGMSAPDFQAIVWIAARGSAV